MEKHKIGSYGLREGESMSQDNSPLGDRPQPRYQPPSVTGSYAAGNDELRPADWPPPNGPTPGMGAGAWGGYQPGPPINNGYNANYPGYQPGPATLGYFPPPVEDPQAAAYKKAAAQVDARLKFFKHLRTYLIINIFLWFIAFAIAPAGAALAGRIWPMWITVFWGIGLLSQWWRTFGASERRRQEMIEEELRRMQR